MTEISGLLDSAKNIMTGLEKTPVVENVLGSTAINVFMMPG